MKKGKRTRNPERMQQAIRDICRGITIEDFLIKYPGYERNTYHVYKSKYYTNTVGANNPTNDGIEKLMKENQYFVGMAAAYELGKEVYNYFNNKSKPTPHKTPDNPPTREKEPEIEPTGKEPGEWVIKSRYRKRVDPFDNDRKD